MSNLETVLENQKIPDMVCISKEKYDQLIDDSEKLYWLECGGVDNWEWYGESLAGYRKWKGEEKEEEEDEE